MRIFESAYQKMASYENHLIKYNKLIDKVKNLFQDEQREVICMLRKSGGYQKDHPLGPSIHTLIEDLCASPDSHFYHNKTYIAAMINSLTFFGLFELRLDNTMAITPFGLEYLVKSDYK